MNENSEKIEKLYCLARDRFKEEDLNPAIESLKALLVLDFKHLDAHFMLALIYAKDQSFELSNEHFRFCLTEKYDKEELHKLIAQNHIQLQLYQDAIFELQKHLHLYKDDDDAYSLLGDIYMRQKKYNFAIKVYLEAIDITPKHAIHYYKLAKAYKENEQYKEAILETKKATALELDYHEAYFLEGTLHEYFHDYKIACECYQKAIDIDEHIALYHNNLALSLSLSGHPSQAKVAQAEAIKLEPNNQQFIRNLSNI
jgi:tetratricopeptide (TPR) repeat protein